MAASSALGSTRLRPGRATRRSTIDALTLAAKARDVLRGKKGEDIALLDVRGMSGVTDYYLIVSGGSPPHLKALFREVMHELKQAGVPCYRKSGNPETGWMVLDYVDVIIHIFSPQARSYYAVEELWAGAPRQ